MHRALFGIHELAQLFGVKKQTIDMRFKQGYWDTNFRKFPDPAYVVSAGRFWTWEQLHAYLHADMGFKQLGWARQKEERQARERLEVMGQLFIDDRGNVQ